MKRKTACKLSIKFKTSLDLFKELHKLTENENSVQNY